MKGIVMVLLVAIGHPVIAQNWQEWTKQRATQIKYLAQQIAGLKVYLDYTAKGYQIAEIGLNAIGKIKRGDLALHDAFFASLKAVNPKIASSAKVAAALARGVQIAKVVRQTKSGLQASRQFAPEEVEAYKKGLEGLLNNCTETIKKQIHLVTSGHYEMSDDERMKRIEEVTKEMDAYYAFCMEQCSGLGRLTVQRTADVLTSSIPKN